MEYLLHIMIFLCVAVGVSSHTDSAGELYWKTMLPNARMPNAIKSLLTSASPSSPFDNKIGNDEKSEENDPTAPFNYNYAAQKDDPTAPFNYNYAAQKDDPTAPFNYNYAVKKKLKRSSNTTIFFLQRDLHLGSKLKLNFAKNIPLSSSSFLPRQISDSIPFSSSKFPEIFSRLSVQPASMKAQFIKDTINRCEEKPIKGEEQFCATSLECMIDFSLSKLGSSSTNNVEAISTETVNSTTIQKYTINGVKKIGGDSSVVCHKLKYPYAVFYCHKTCATQVYMVSLGGDHGGEAEAVAICHQDTSAWNPKHMSFALLNVHPGTAPICHFLPEDHVVWIDNK